MTIQVGDKLALKDYSTYCIYTVIKILPSGRIKAQWDEHPIFISVLNPNLSVRGERGTKKCSASRRTLKMKSNGNGYCSALKKGSCAAIRSHSCKCNHYISG